METTMFQMSPILALPFQTVNRRVAITGISGSGKSYTSAVMVEEMLKYGAQVIIIDPKDDWYGIRYNKDGQTLRYQIAALGGERGDLPVVHDKAQEVARYLGETGHSCVLSLNGMTVAQQREYVEAFCWSLYLGKRPEQFRTPMQLFIDECDIFAPQRLTKEKEPCFAAVDNIARRGRSYGIGLTMITQRPAVINKDTLSQADCLLTMRLVLPHDRKVLLEWVNGKDMVAEQDTELVKEFGSSLPHLRRGEGWCWFPSFGIFSRTQIRLRETYDSSRTPEFVPAVNVSAVA